MTKPLIEGVVPTKELLDAPITWVCDEKDISSYTHVQRTCDACKHYTPSDRPQVWAKHCGSCALIDDPAEKDYLEDRISSVCESGESWAWVGPKFGCIHWEAKSQIEKQGAEPLVTLTAPSGERLAAWYLPKVTS